MEYSSYLRSYFMEFQIPRFIIKAFLVLIVSILILLQFLYVLFYVILPEDEP